jgi:predicted RNA binding protein YcfA (HicA-like mRNA interferase family)
VRPGGSKREPHVKMKKEGVKHVVTVPTNRNPIPKGTFAKILRDAEVTREQFDKAANEVL